MHHQSCAHRCTYLRRQHTYVCGHTHLYAPHTHIHTKRNIFTMLPALFNLYLQSSHIGIEVMERKKNSTLTQPTGCLSIPLSIWRGLKEQRSTNAAVLHTTCSFWRRERFCVGVHIWHQTSSFSKCMFVFTNAAKMWHTLLYSPANSMLETLWQQHVTRIWEATLRLLSKK